MRQLDAIANEIDAGRLTAEEGTKRADALAKELEARLAPLAQERLRQAQQMKSRSRLLITVAVLGIAYMVFKLVTLFTGSAP